MGAAVISALLGATPGWMANREYVHRIETLADYVLWHAHGQTLPVEFDPKFERAFRDAVASREARAAEPAL